MKNCQEKAYIECGSFKVLCFFETQGKLVFEELDFLLILLADCFKLESLLLEFPLVVFKGLQKGLFLLFNLGFLACLPNTTNEMKQ